LKIVHFTSVHTPFDIRIFQKECRSIADAGYEVSFVVPHVRDETVAGVNISAIPKSNGRISRMTRVVWNALRAARRQNADIYQFHDSELIPAALVLRLMGKRVVYDVHEDVPRDILSKDYLPKILRKPLAWVVERIENFSTKLLSGTVAATPFIGKRFELLNGRAVVIHNYPRLGELATPIGVSWQQRECAVTYAGGILPDRGIRELVTAMSLVPPEMGVRLKLAGEFFPPSFKNELADLPGWDHVDVLGLLDRTDLAKLLGSVRAGVVPFLPEPNHINAMPHKLFEYMSASIPVIASDFPLWRQMLEEIGCGVVMNPCDPQSIASSIVFIIAHPEQAEKMGLCGRRAVENQFNWEREQYKLLRFYTELIHA
jgi:glycosyltransferase involved in cell wall biosynthesis